MDLQEVLEVEEVFQVERVVVELVVKEMQEVQAVHLVHQLQIKLEVAVEVPVEQEQTEHYLVDLEEEQVVQAYQVILQDLVLKEQEVVEMELQVDL